MNNYSISDKTGTAYTRITKAAALKKYASGETIALCANKMRPGWPWNPEHTINLENNTEGTSAGIKDIFNNLCNAFMFYNCTSETGKYIAFYSVKEAENENN